MRVLNGSVATALVAGMVGGLLAPLLWPAAARAARPAAKRALRTGLAAYDRGREMTAEWLETASDMMAEVQAERAEEIRAKTGMADEPPSDESVVPIGAGTRAEGAREEGDRKAHA